MLSQIPQDVIHGPNTAGNGNAVLFNGTTGKIVKDAGFVPENVANKATDLTTNDNTHYPSTQAVQTAINNAISGVNPAVAVQAATAAVLPNTPVYNNGVSGTGATLTSTFAAHLLVDGYSVAANDRILVKNQASSFQNGVYIVTNTGSVVLNWILTRADDYDTPDSINNTGAIPVTNNGTNALTSWLLTSFVVTIGTDALTYTEFSLNPNTIVTLDGIQTLTNKTLTAPILTTPQLGVATATSLGIGTNNIAPVTPLQVVETATTAMRGGTFDQYSTGTSSSRITARKARGTFASPAIVVAGDSLGSFAAFGHDGTNFVEAGSVIIQAAVTISAGVIPGKMLLTTANASGVNTTAVTIDSSQNAVFVGTTTELSSTINGTGGAGFAELQTQSSDPASGAASSVRLFSNASGHLSWKKQVDGFVRSLVSVLTADRSYTLPDATTTLVGTDTTQTVTNKTLGNIKWASVNKSANYTVTSADYIIRCTANTFTVTMPTAAGITDQVFIIKNVGTGIITVAAAAIQTFDGSSTLVFGQYVSYTIKSNGSGWDIL